ncbi:hypothetical protein [Pseudoclavibacter sp. Z016]|uniref:hypothetical protein n=1 Tax=Pseudoclavibacter sp. Z016 TaxID=2080581 RepID=UPI0015E2BF61|nr:hypothetical protein [Pseudoclavibacter sp. Z016]
MTVINFTTGEVLRELTIDLSKDYQPTGNSKGPTRKRNSPNLHQQVRAISMSCDISPSG